MNKFEKLLRPGPILQLFLIVGTTITAAHPLTASSQELTKPSDQTNTEIPEIRRYAVELIIFEYTDSAAAASNNEVFLPDLPKLEATTLRGLPDSLHSGQLDSNQIDPNQIDPNKIDNEYPLPDESTLLSTPVEEVIDPLDAAIEILGPDQHTMDDIYQKLVRLEAYRPMMRIAWTQATYDKNQTAEIPLSRFGRPPAGLDGSLTLYLSRYLHFVVDLELDSGLEMTDAQFADAQSRQSPQYFGDTPDESNLQRGYDESISRKVLYRIDEDRIVRNGELRYYDHPKFGVVARIKRATPEEEAEILPANVVPGAN